MEIRSSHHKGPQSSATHLIIWTKQPARREKSRMKMGAAAGPGCTGLSSQLLWKLRHEGHTFKAYLGYKVSSMPAEAT